MEEGRARIWQQSDDKHKELCVVAEGEYFGERALVQKEVRSATVTALSPRVKVLVLEMEDFEVMLGPLKELQEAAICRGETSRLASSIETTLLDSDSSATTRGDEDVESDFNTAKPSRFPTNLDQLDTITILGIGSLGTVRLVRSKNEASQAVYALKCMRKELVLTMRQVDHVVNEKRVLQGLNSSFIYKLYTTMQDRDNIYMLVEFLPGGELSEILGNQKGYVHHDRLNSYN